VKARNTNVVKGNGHEAVSKLEREDTVALRAVDGVKIEEGKLEPRPPGCEAEAA
jgi:hypothetical protein